MELLPSLYLYSADKDKIELIRETGIELEERGEGRYAINVFQPPSLPTMMALSSALSLDGFKIIKNPGENTLHIHIT